MCIIQLILFYISLLLHLRYLFVHLRSVQSRPRRGRRRGRHVAVDARCRRVAVDAARPTRSSVHSSSGIFSAGKHYSSLLAILYWNSLPLRQQLRFVFPLMYGISNVPPGQVKYLKYLNVSNVSRNIFKMFQVMEILFY